MGRYHFEINTYLIIGGKIMVLKSGTDSIGLIIMDFDVATYEFLLLT